MHLPEIELLLLKLMSSILLFRDLEREALLELLKGASKAAFRARDIVFEQNRSGYSMYIVVQGKFEVFKTIDGRDAHIAHVLPGQHFGEIALVTDRPRMASVRAVEDSVALCLTKANIFAQPSIALYLLKNMACLMSAHLSEMNEEVLMLDMSRRIPRGCRPAESNKPDESPQPSRVVRQIGR